MYEYITTNTTTQVVSAGVRKVVITVNKDLTGTIKVIDGTSGTTANVATITNPSAGDTYEYWDLTDGLRVVTSASCDITVNASGSMGVK